ncbi:MAG: ATP-grasp domain-containing protein [Cyclobacteriaceae bacterium]|nr:ATP-grasp domain-containing protein [Cyclobacteriaceae bacterium]
MGLFKKILIANRGEIAIRIQKTARRLGIHTVAICTPEDADDMYVRMADESWQLKGKSLADTYLNITRIIDLAIRSGAEAVHPGYGFLSENPEFADACEKHHMVFIGPPGEMIRLMGNKITSGKFVESLGVPVPETITGNKSEILSRRHSIDFPVLVKAAGGGGGKGMRIVESAEHLETALLSTAREAKAYFDNEEIYLEKYIEKPRHIEVQILGDHYGNVIHLFERECSVQRRYQKIIEETPAVKVPEKIRERIRHDAVTIAGGMQYRNAGTIEFLVDGNWDYYFLEMNTRLQVEHPVTEMTTGIDLVEQQIRIASGEKLGISQENIRQTGHAMECRLYAEDPARDFLPSPGRITLYREPVSEKIRMDSGISGPGNISPRFDPLIGKLVVRGVDRKEVLEQMSSALSSCIIHGVTHNIPFLQSLIRHPLFKSNDISTHFYEENKKEILENMKHEQEKLDPLLPLSFFLVHQLNTSRQIRPVNVWQEIGFWRLMMEIPVKSQSGEMIVSILGNDNQGFKLEMGARELTAGIISAVDNDMTLEINGKTLRAVVSSGNGGKGWVSFEGQLFEFSRLDVLPGEYIFTETGSGENSHSGKIFSPMPGKIVDIRISRNATVSKGDILLVVEAMKMENSLVAPFDGQVSAVHARMGQLIGNRELLMELVPSGKEN